MSMGLQAQGHTPTGVSSQENTEVEPAAHLRGCRVGTPNPQFKPHRAPLLQGGGNPYIGNRRQLVVLASFQDQDFAEDHNGALQKWNKIFNAIIYDLQGRRLSSPTKGLYIQGNRLRIKR